MCSKAGLVPLHGINHICNKLKPRNALLEFLEQIINFLAQIFCLSKLKNQDRQNVSLKILQLLSEGIECGFLDKSALDPTKNLQNELIRLKFPEQLIKLLETVINAIEKDYNPNQWEQILCEIQLQILNTKTTQVLEDAFPVLVDKDAQRKLIESHLTFVSGGGVDETPEKNRHLAVEYNQRMLYAMLSTEYAFALRYCANEGFQGKFAFLVIRQHLHNSVSSVIKYMREHTLHQSEYAQLLQLLTYRKMLIAYFELRTGREDVFVQALQKHICALCDPRCTNVLTIDGARVCSFPLYVNKHFVVCHIVFERDGSYSFVLDDCGADASLMEQEHLKRTSLILSRSESQVYAQARFVFKNIDKAKLTDQNFLRNLCFSVEITTMQDLKSHLLKHLGELSCVENGKGLGQLIHRRDILGGCVCLNPRLFEASLLQPKLRRALDRSLLKQLITATKDSQDEDVQAMRAFANKQVEALS